MYESKSLVQDAYSVLLKRFQFYLPDSPLAMQLSNEGCLIIPLLHTGVKLFSAIPSVLISQIVAHFHE